MERRSSTSNLVTHPIVLQGERLNVIVWHFGFWYGNPKRKAMQKQAKIFFDHLLLLGQLMFRVTFDCTRHWFPWFLGLYLVVLMI